MSIIFANGISTLTILIWFKIISLALIYYFINIYKRQEFYYYQNLGVSKSFLWISTLLFDSFMFILLLILTLKFK